MSSFLNISILVLATMVLVLAGMVGYLYWQQNKLLRAVSSLSGFVQSQFTPPLNLQTHEHTESQPQHESHEEDSDSDDESDDDSECDDRISVEIVEEQKVEIPATKEVEKVEKVEDVDDFQGKTAVQLRELLNKKGIPFGKRDSKSVLLELLKASS